MYILIGIVIISCILLNLPIYINFSFILISLYIKTLEWLGYDFKLIIFALKRAHILNSFCKIHHQNESENYWPDDLERIKG